MSISDYENAFDRNIFFTEINKINKETWKTQIVEPF